MPNQRDTTIDTLRGIAIFTMIAANMAGMILEEPHPFWLRLYGTFAAPMFILLSGMMVGLTVQIKGYGLGKFLKRGLMLLMIGALIDVLVWRIYPITTVDVLYLIAVSLPVTCLFLRLKTSLRWVLIIVLFLITPLLQKVLGYTEYPTEFYLTGEVSVPVANQTNILNHWLIDGWFPLFPWLGFSFMGVNLIELRREKRFPRYSIGLLITGIIIWELYPGALLTREGYSELFYPPAPGFILTALGIIFTLVYLVDKTNGLTIYKPFQVLGKASLLMYILHLAVINFGIKPFWPQTTLPLFTLLYFFLSGFLWLIAYGMDLARKRRA